MLLLASSTLMLYSGASLVIFRLYLQLEIVSTYLFISRPVLIILTLIALAVQSTTYT